MRVVLITKGERRIKKEKNRLKMLRARQTRMLTRESENRKRHSQAFHPIAVIRNGALIAGRMLSTPQLREVLAKV